MRGVENLLLEAGLITERQLQVALKEQEDTHRPVEDILVELGYVSEEHVCEYLARQYHIPYINMGHLPIDPDVVTEIPDDVAYKYVAIAFEKQGNVLTVAMREPLNFQAIDEIQFLTNCTVQPKLASRTNILKRLAEFGDHYKVLSVDRLLRQMEMDPNSVKLGKESSLDSVKEIADQAPMIKLVNLLILQALKKRASDIHIQSEDNEIVVRYRIDGVLQESKVFPAELGPAIISRIKIMSEMDIAERRLPQDGHFDLKVENKDIDFRVSTIPTVNGEKVVIRILDRGSLLLGLDYLGFNEEILNKLKSIIRKPNGIVIITGPTGSGKTTTLYSALHTINSPDKNITTVENPVEYRLRGIAQMEVKPKIGLTFAHALRSILRQDPDVILIGEIRDLETSEIAIRASLTGHLVFATLHTNDAAGAMTRLVDMGAEPFLIASSVKAILSQRLVRVICPNCKESYEMPSAHLRRLGITPAAESVTLYRGVGCKQCFYTGYHSRIALAELMTVDEEIRRFVVEKTPSSVIKSAAVRAGMKTLREDGIQKVLNGETTLEEMLRVVEEEEG